VSSGNFKLTIKTIRVTYSTKQST